MVTIARQVVWVEITTDNDGDNKKCTMHLPSCNPENDMLNCIHAMNTLLESDVKEQADRLVRNTYLSFSTKPRSLG
jgi:hypothetical protein